MKPAVKETESLKPVASRARDHGREKGDKEGEHVEGQELVSQPHVSWGSHHRGFQNTQLHVRSSQTWGQELTFWACGEGSCRT